MTDTRPCPCCSGAAHHIKRTSVDDFKEVKCASCDEYGQVAVCGECDGDAVFGLWPSATECYACRGSGLDFNECDMAKTLENTRERPAAEDF